MSFARQKLIAAACALGLGLSVVAQAAGQPAEGHAEKRADARHGQRSELAMLERPRKRFAQSVELARRKAERARKARASDTAGAESGNFPSPESSGVSSATLESIAACESGGDPAAVSADGTYRGKYQFDYGTWASVGGSGDPAAAPEVEQDYRAALLYSRGGSSPWPICGA